MRGERKKYIQRKYQIISIKVKASRERKRTRQERKERNINVGFALYGIENMPRNQTGYHAYTIAVDHTTISYGRITRPLRRKKYIRRKLKKSRI